MELGRLAAKTGASMDKFLPGAYQDFYYRNLFEIGRKEGLRTPVTRVDAGQLESVLRVPWSGKNYSQRIWTNARKLADTLEMQIFAAVQRGATIRDMSRVVEQRMNVGRHEATRLVRTELNYIENRATLDSIKESGMRYYQFVATLDKRTSVTCREHDGKTYSIDDYSPGTNAPPLHPHCRSTVVGSVKGREPAGERAAREDGVSGYTRVPADMSYEKWYNFYIRNTSTNKLINLQTANGLTVTGISKHQQERADERKLPVADIRDALINPLHIETIRETANGRSQRFIGEQVTVNINPDTGIIITSWKTGKSKVKQYRQEMKQDE